MPEMKWRPKDWDKNLDSICPVSWNAAGGDCDEMMCKDCDTMEKRAIEAGASAMLEALIGQLDEILQDYNAKYHLQWTFDPFTSSDKDWSKVIKPSQFAIRWLEEKR
jgi:hypothetical protein